MIAPPLVDRLVIGHHAQSLSANTTESWPSSQWCSKTTPSLLSKNLAIPLKRRKGTTAGFDILQQISWSGTASRKNPVLRDDANGKASESLQLNLTLWLSDSIRPCEENPFDPSVNPKYASTSLLFRGSASSSKLQPPQRKVSSSKPHIVKSSRAPRTPNLEAHA